LNFRLSWCRPECHGAGLARANFSGFDLNEVDLSGTDLRQVDLSQASLRRADLTAAILTDADLRPMLQTFYVNNADKVDRVSRRPAGLRQTCP
jgi:uncharacterized protein YjbI with pentapeptide repeats